MTNTFNYYKNERGQVLLLTILVTVVVLTLAVAAARRTTVDIRQLNAATESNRALTAAEAGVENVLLSLKNGIVPDACGTMEAEECALLFGGSGVSSIEVETLQSLSLSNLPEEQTVEVTLFNQLTNEDFDGTLDIRWEEGSAIAITVILRDSGNPPKYFLYREAFNCGNVAAGNGFTATTPVDGWCTITSINIGALEAQYESIYSHPDDATHPIVALSMRIRPMYADTGISVNGLGDDDLPTQAFSIISTGTSGDSQRTIQATRTNEAMPSIFDFVLFNGSVENALTSSDGTKWVQFLNGDIHSESEINVDVPNGSNLCVGEGGCIFTSGDNIGTGEGDVSDEGWQQENYGATFPIEQFSYDALLRRLSAKVRGTSSSLSNLSATINTCGQTDCIVRITGALGDAEISPEDFDILPTSKPVVVFVGNGAGENDVNLHIPIKEFVGKNVVFIVSGDVILTHEVDIFQAGVIFDGLFTVRD